jgi:hypothetical protein
MNSNWPNGCFLCTICVVTHNIILVCKYFTWLSIGIMYCLSAFSSSLLAFALLLIEEEDLHCMHLAAEKEMMFQWLPLLSKFIVVQGPNVCYVDPVSVCVSFF